MGRYSPPTSDGRSANADHPSVLPFALHDLNCSRIFIHLPAVTIRQSAKTQLEDLHITLFSLML